MNSCVFRIMVLLGLLAWHSSTFCDDSQIASVTVIPDLVYADVDGQKLMLDLHVPSAKGKLTAGRKPPLYVWIHGGGWRGGSRKNPRPYGMVQHGFSVASISYRFSQTSRFPAQIHDCKAAIRWLRANSDRYGYSADWIAVGGGSAGGQLALLLGTSGDVAELEGTVGGNLNHSSRVQAVVDYYGPSDFVLRGKSQPKRAYTDKSGSYAMLGGKDGQIPVATERLASPVTYVSTDDPPLLVFQGTEDNVVLPDQSERIAERYQEAGLDVQLINVKGAGHGGRIFFEGQNRETAIRFLQQHRPNQADQAFLGPMDNRNKVLIAAHRGGYSNDVRDRAPENSIANLKLAIQKGYDVYETDIQRTADGVFVIMHDPTIERETTGQGEVRHKTLAQLKALKKRYRNGSVSEERVATLKELLKAGKGQILFKPDLKPGVIHHFEELAAVISQLKMTEQVFLRTGFGDAERIGQLFDADCPRVEVMFKTKSVAQVKAVIEQFQPQTIQVDIAKGKPISAGNIKSIRHAISHGVLVETHVYKNETQWTQLRQLGVGMFHTGDPDRLIEFLNQ